MNLTGKGNRFGLTGKMGENKEEKDYVLKKIMIETGLGTLEELAYYLANIDRINEESFAQMNNFAD